MTDDGYLALADDGRPKGRGWVRNAKGNLTYIKGRFLLTVFQAPPGSGRYRWSRAIRWLKDRTVFSPGPYGSEAAAMAAALEEAEASKP